MLTRTTFHLHLKCVDFVLAVAICHFCEYILGLNVGKEEYWSEILKSDTFHDIESQNTIWNVYWKSSHILLLPSNKRITLSAST